MRDINQLKAQVYKDSNGQAISNETAPLEVTEEEFLNLVSETLFYGRKVTIKREGI